MHFASVALVLFCVSFMNCSPTRWKEGCVTCGKTKEATATRKFVSTRGFTTEELEGTFGRSLETGTLCTACIRAMYHWRKTGKVTKVSDQTFVILVCAEGQ